MPDELRLLSDLAASGILSGEEAREAVERDEAEERLREAHARSLIPSRFARLRAWSAS